ncbi:hypothetical protein [Sphingobium ummariense]|nr:hypothetical protein [Sphingobium ummariense]
MSRPDNKNEAPRRRRKQSRAGFLEEHPVCCYCNGRRASTERDHAPARIIFRGKHGPENFEFPSCSLCNRASALSEQVTAFYIRSLDQDSSRLDEAEFDKLIEGLVNNAPEAVPFPTFRQNRAYSEMPDRLITIPPMAYQLITLFGTKMLYALHYRVTGKPANPTQRRLVAWQQAGTQGAEDIRHNASQWFDGMIVGQRRNVDLGNQFRFQTGYNERHGYLGLHMSFGEALVFFCVLGPARHMVKLKPKPELYVSIADLGAKIKRRNP